MVRRNACLAKDLLRGDPQNLSAWLDAPACAGRFSLCLVLIAIGTGLYGSTIGLWRGPEQAAFAAAKFPLVVGLTCGGNALLNGLLAQSIGSGLSFRQATLAILMSFAVAALVLLALVPIALFLLWNTPSLRSGDSSAGHSLTLLAHVVAIAYAGWVGNRRLYGLLARRSRDAGKARATLLAWLGGNLLLGSQISWILRPFIGNPHLPVEFLRDHPLRGGFYEQLWRSLVQLFA